MNSRPANRAPTVQEAIDVVVQAFDHPQRLELHYENEHGEKRTAIRASDGDETTAHGFRFDGREDAKEPGLLPRQDETTA